MVNSILLKLNKELFFKLKKDKARREEKAGKLLRWEDYIGLLFGFSKRK
jgi:hypothetical protein